MIEEFHKEAKAAGVVREREKRDRSESRDAPPNKRQRSNDRKRRDDRRSRDFGRDRGECFVFVKGLKNMLNGWRIIIWRGLGP